MAKGRRAQPPDVGEKWRSIPTLVSGEAGVVRRHEVHIVVRRHIIQRRLRKKPPLPGNPSDVPIYDGRDVPAVLIDRRVAPCRANNYGLRPRGPISTRAERRHLLTGWATDTTLALRDRREAARLLLWMGGRCSCAICTESFTRATR